LKRTSAYLDKGIEPIFETETPEGWILYP